jgi:hypothetical protein
VNEIRQNSVIKDIDLIPTLQAILAGTIKIDDARVNGLLGVNNSLAYRVHEIERHFHNNEYWLGAAAVPAGETNIADEMGPGIAPFPLLSGNDAYGLWVQVLGSADTPIHASSVEMDAHRVLVTTTDSTEPFHVQFCVGETAGLAACITNKDYTGFAYIAATNNADSGISDIISRRIASGTKVWARSICIGQNAKTINIYVGIHEYEG